MSFIVSLNFIVLAGMFHRSPKDMARSPRAYSADGRIGGLVKTEIRHQRGGAYEREIYKCRVSTLLPGNTSTSLSRHL